MIISGSSCVSSTVSSDTKAIMADELNTDNLKKAGIIPDVVDDFKPEIKIHVKYNGVEIQGQELTPEETQGEPEVIIDGPLANNAIFTLAFVDPDAPSRENHKLRNWRHWLVVNIPGNEIAKGKTISPHFGPAPPKGTGPHRYTFWYYRQKGPIEINLNNDPSARGGFNLRDFAKEHSLVGPLAGAFFLAQNK